MSSKRQGDMRQHLADMSVMGRFCKTPAESGASCGDAAAAWRQETKKKKKKKNPPRNKKKKKKKQKKKKKKKKKNQKNKTHQKKKKKKKNKWGMKRGKGFAQVCQWMAKRKSERYCLHMSKKLRKGKGFPRLSSATTAGHRCRGVCGGPRRRDVFNSLPLTWSAVCEAIPDLPQTLYGAECAGDRSPRPSMARLR